MLSYDQQFRLTRALYKDGKLTPINFGPDIPVAFFLDLNEAGIISGTTQIAGHNRGFQYDTRTGKANLLQPLPGDPESWALGINKRGDILGYSFVFSAIERVGVWGKSGSFEPYFVEGTPAFPTISNRLLMNDSNQIVITAVSQPASEQYHSYLVPTKGVRLSLDSLVRDLPSSAGSIANVQQINNHGSMWGYTLTPTFESTRMLLQRIGRGD